MCDTLVIIQTDRVIFAKNSDRDPNEAQALEWRPRRTHASGAELRCTWIAVPQVRETHATLLSRPFWMWGAEMGANEHGVVIGNEAVFTRQPYARIGLTGMDLVRLALERAATAEEACTVITRLLDEFGQGGGCGYESKRFTYHNSFLIADPVGAFVLETAGKQFAIERVAGTRSISNGLTIPGFAEQHTDRLKTRVSCCRLRQPRTMLLAQGAKGLHDVFAILRDHGPGRDGPRYTWLNGGMDAPCMHAGGVAAASQTTASWVAELSSGGVRHWVTATAAPCTSLFKPVEVGQPANIGPTSGQLADQSLWWRHERFHRRVLRNPAAFFPLFQRERDALEARWLEHVPGTEEAFEEHNRLLREWEARVWKSHSPDIRPRFVRHYWSRRNRRAVLPV
ncbi:MAG: peptidase U34 [Candidatus Hydrogenedentes bacterium]|nr:peptidase U34 [Candidatus Hydrogenedentota bacterium]MBI3119042.1 peptidase U34 [Candidatus Hydrogenedentota bacterium]